MKFICILASSANLRSLQFDKFSTKKFKTLISRILILFKKEKKVGIDECVFAKNGRIISIQFCRKKKKSFCVKAASLICWASSVGFFVLGSLPAFGFNHACHRSWRVYLEQMIRVERASEARKLSLVMKRRLMMGFVWKVPHEWPPKRPIKTLGREIEQILRYEVRKFLMIFCERI